MSDLPRPGGYIDNAALDDAIAANERALGIVYADMREHAKRCPILAPAVIELSLLLAQQTQALTRMREIRVGARKESEPRTKTNGRHVS